jgi:hypothetical protein
MLKNSAKSLVSFSVFNYGFSIMNLIMKSFHCAFSILQVGKFGKILTGQNNPTKLHHTSEDDDETQCITLCEMKLMSIITIAGSEP